MTDQCGHGKTWAQPCDECEKVSLRETIKYFGGIVERAKAKLAALEKEGDHG